MRGCFVSLLVLSGTVLGTALFAQDADLILYYDYETLDAKVTDLSGKNHHGVVNGKITLEAGKRGKAARFAPMSFIDVDGAHWPPDQIPRKGMSVLAWINCDAQTDNAIFNARAADGTWLVHPEFRSEGHFRWVLRSGGGVTIFDIRGGKATPKTWYHYAGVYDSSEGVGKLYIDGVEVGSANGKLSIAKDWGQGARVGLNIDNARPFTGLMDDLNVWKRGLTLDEVKTIMEFGPLPQAVSPKGKLTTAWGRLRKAF